MDKDNAEYTADVDATGETENDNWELDYTDKETAAKELETRPLNGRFKLQLERWTLTEDRDGDPQIVFSFKTIECDDPDDEYQEVAAFCGLVGGKRKQFNEAAIALGYAFPPDNKIRPSTLNELIGAACIAVLKSKKATMGENKGKMRVYIQQLLPCIEEM